MGCGEPMCLVFKDFVAENETRMIRGAHAVSKVVAKKVKKTEEDHRGDR